MGKIMLRNIIITAVIVLYISILNAKIYPKAIKQKIINYLSKQNISVKIDDITIENDLPHYKLYDINIKDYIVKNNDIIVNVIISDFFNKSRCWNLKCSVKKIISLQTYNINSDVKLIYQVNNIRIEDTGKIIRKEQNYYFIKNSFGKEVKCIYVRDNLFKVIE